MSVNISGEPIKKILCNGGIVKKWIHNGKLVYSGVSVVVMKSATIRETGTAYCYSTPKEITGVAFLQYDKNQIQTAFDMNITVSMDGSIIGRNRDRSYNCEVGLYNSATKKYLTVAKKTINGVWDTAVHFSGTKTFTVVAGDILKPYAYMGNPYGADLFLSLNSCTITYDPDNQ